MEQKQPSAAEIARTLLTGIGTATLESAATQSAVPMLHAETASGQFILVGDQLTLAALGLDSPVNEIVYRENLPAADTTRKVLLPVRLRISAKAPVLDLNVERAGVLLTGTLTPLPAAAVPGALRSTCSGVRLGEVLGYRSDARLFVFRPAQAEVSTAAGPQQISAEELALAQPDPLAAVEGPLLAAAEGEAGGELLAMVHGLDKELHAEELGFASLREVEAVRAVGLDRYGLTLQCTWDASRCIWRALLDGDNGCPAQRLHHDGADVPSCHSATATVRIPFPEPILSPAHALPAVRALTGAFAPIARG